MAEAKCLNEENLLPSEIDELAEMIRVHSWPLSDDDAFVFAKILPIESVPDKQFLVGVSTPLLLWQQSFVGDIIIEPNRYISTAQALLTFVKFIDRSGRSQVGAVFVTICLDGESYALMIESYIKAVRLHSKMLWEKRGNHTEARNGEFWFPYSIMTDFPDKIEPLKHALEYNQKAFGKREGLFTEPRRCMCNRYFKMLIYHQGLRSCHTDIRNLIMSDLDIVSRAQSRAIFIRSWKLFMDKWPGHFDCIQNLFRMNIPILGKDDSSEFERIPASLDSWAAFKRCEYGLSDAQMEMRMSLALSAASSSLTRDKSFLEFPPLLSPMSTRHDTLTRGSMFQMNLSGRISLAIGNGVFVFMRRRSIISSRYIHGSFLPVFPLPDYSMWKFVYEKLLGCLITPCPRPVAMKNLPAASASSYKELLTLKGHSLFNVTREAGRILLFYTDEKGKNTESDFVEFMEKMETPYHINDFASLTKFQLTCSISSLPLNFLEFISADLWEAFEKKAADPKWPKRMVRNGFPFLVEPVKGGPFCSCANFLLKNVCEHVLLGLYACFPTCPLPGYLEKKH